MRVKTYVSLPEELLKAIDKRAKKYHKSRTDFIEAAVKAFIAQTIRDEQNARDIEIINQHADFLNRESADVLEYQAHL